LKKENKIFGVLDRADPPSRWQVFPAKDALAVIFRKAPVKARRCLRHNAVGGSYPDMSAKTFSAFSPERTAIGQVRAKEKASSSPRLSPAQSEWTKPADPGPRLIDDISGATTN